MGRALTTAVQACAIGAALTGLALLAACGSFSATPPPADAAASSNADASGSDASDGLDASLGDAGDGALIPVDGGGKLIAFVTAIGYPDAITPTLADVKCQSEAKQRLPGKFVAWFSSTTTPAPARLVTTQGTLVDGPWYRVDGARIAASRAALLDATNVPLENPITRTATNDPSTASVWTATLADGGYGSACPGSNPTSGTASKVDAGWTDQKQFAPNCGSALSLYCFQVE